MSTDSRVPPTPSASGQASAEDEPLGLATTRVATSDPRSAATADTVEQLEDVRPGGGLLRAKMRAALTEKLFGIAAEPTRMGRFVILDRLGQGGMGEVYSAYDPKLDRRVALKLLLMGDARGDGGARERLEREAVALARLSHPNVVPVHDVGMIQCPPDEFGGVDEQMFMVMELVEGQTLHTWVEAEPRTWRQIVDAYRQAGQGLAAAHAVDLVHRDFKPHNVQVGEDGRIRVLDFGLARSIGGQARDAAHASSERDAELTRSLMALNADTEPPGAHAEPRRPTPSRQGPLYTPLTRTGAILGTPAYMSPEQFAGRHAGPASDQFSFCVALYEALYNARPFAGNTVSELSENTLAGRLEPPPRSSNVPGWLYPILARGLAVDPDERYPSMSALLAELGRDPARARRRRVMIGAMVALLGAVVGLSVVVFTGANTAPGPCAGARERLSGVFDDAVRERLAAFFQGIDHPYARHVGPHVLRELDGYGDRFVALHEGACRAHRRGAESAQLLDRRMVCLERRRRAMASAIAVLEETDPRAVESAVDVVENLPDIEYCADEVALLAEVAPPENAELAQRVSDIRAQASRVQSLLDAGRYRDAMAEVRSLLAEAEAIGYRPLFAELYILLGRLHWSLHEPHRAVAAQQRAAELALSAGAYDLGVEALARLVYTQGVTADGAGALDRISLFEALAENLPAKSFARALFYNNVGVVCRAREQSERARQYFERALAARPPDGSRGELDTIGYNLMLITDDYARRDALLRDTLAAFERTLGPAHPRTLNQRVISAPHFFSPEEAYAVLEPACSLYQSVHAEMRVQRGKCWRLLADLDVELGHLESAARHYQEAALLLANDEDNMDARFGTVSLGLAALYSGDGARAIAVLGALLARVDGPDAEREHPGPWWELQPVACAALGLGLAELEAKDPAAAVAPLERAHEILERLTQQTRAVARERQLARTRSALARALCSGASALGGADDALDPACARARELMAQARAWYDRAGTEPGH